MNKRESLIGFTAPTQGEVCVHYDAANVTDIYDATDFDETKLEPRIGENGEAEAPEIMRFEAPELRFMKPCGDCGLCCMVLAVEEIDKPAGKWCQHFKPGKGCAKVDDKDRPAYCERFDCLWRQDVDGHLPAFLRPDKCHVVLGNALNSHGVVAFVHPKHPNAYKDKKVFPLLRALTQAEAPVYIVAGDKRMKVE